jgi:hypothetical protein
MCSRNSRRCLLYRESATGGNRAIIAELTVKLYSMTKSPFFTPSAPNYAIVKEITDEHILFSNGLKLYSEHDSDCREDHFLDFKTLDLDEFRGLEFNLASDNFFNKINEYGIELIPVKGHSIKIAGHGYNDGYYSTNLTLCLSDGRTYDITDCQDISY